MANDKPTYILKDFLTSCAVPQKVVVPERVINDAIRLYKLKSKEDLLDAFASEEISITGFINTRPLDYNPSIMADAYHFEYIEKPGYMAYHQSPNFSKNGKWVLKSFHEPIKGQATLLEDTNFGKVLELLKKGMIEGRGQ